MTRVSPHRRVALAALLAAGLAAGVTGCAAPVAATALRNSLAAGTLPGGPVAADAPPGGPVAGSSPAAADATPLRIMPLGDSITFGIGSATLDSYRRDLRQRLATAGLSVDFVGSKASGTGDDRENEGHPGWTIGQIAAQADQWLAAYRPDVVLLQIGTNDMVRRVDVPGAPARLSALIDQIRAARPGAQVFVARIPSAKIAGYQQRISAFNAAVPGVVARKGPRVHLVDQSSIGGIDLRDSVHPHDFGYAKMAYNWYRAMAKVYATTAWPQGVNPYLATRAYRCALRVVHSSHGPANRVECAWTYLRAVRSTVGGKTTTKRVWQVRRSVLEKHRVVVVPAHDGYRIRRVKVHGRYVTRRVKVHVAATYATRTRRVLRWVAY
ncbi:SGNH/GDSL hydrolase family protein [Krasilnikovia sp. MM14-A1259]|uniref:SGNH/GDSL hydrolase family protein n=1 Tax=Krasilnikovia sp. MM14-A1259 TaxID=3373539 RepID=UPI0037FD3336